MKKTSYTYKRISKSPLNIHLEYEKKNNAIKGPFFYHYTLKNKALSNKHSMTFQANLLKAIRTWILLFIILLIASGITAFPLKTELSWLCNHWPEHNSALSKWLIKCSNAISVTDARFSFLAYGYDWLAFSHIVIAIFFFGVYKDPVRNKWILQAGLIACIAILPLAFIAGYIRQIPIGWQLIDCSFGIFGLIPLLICIRFTKRLEFYSPRDIN